MKIFKKNKVGMSSTATGNSSFDSTDLNVILNNNTDTLARIYNCKGSLLNEQQIIYIELYKLIDKLTSLNDRITSCAGEMKKIEEELTKARQELNENWARNAEAIEVLSGIIPDSIIFNN